MFKLSPLFSRFKKGFGRTNTLALPAEDDALPPYALRRAASVSSVDSQLTLVADDTRYTIVLGTPRRTRPSPPQQGTRPRSQFTIGAPRVIVC